MPAGQGSGRGGTRDSRLLGPRWPARQFPGCLTVRLRGRVRVGGELALRPHRRPRRLRGRVRARRAPAVRAQRVGGGARRGRHAPAVAGAEGGAGGARDRTAPPRAAPRRRGRQHQLVRRASW
eukprot:gene5595-biopygen8760